MIYASPVERGSASGESDEDEDDTGDAEIWLAEARRRIVRRESQASSQQNSLTDNGVNSISTMSINSNDRDSAETF